MKKTIFTGSAVAIITPMNADGSINYEAYGALIDDQIANHTDAIVVAGTTGEASTMTDEEHIEIIRYTVERVAKRIPVIAGTGSNDTYYAIQLSKQAQEAGADALLQVTPYYNKSSQRGLVAHFTAIADAVSVPIVLYNVPSRTGVKISIETYIELAKHPNIVATKEASGDFSLIAEIAAKTDLDLYSGNDDQVLPLLALGGKGVISVSANIIPKQKHDMIALYNSGKTAEALALQNRYLDLEKALFTDVNPIPVKEAMNLLGKDAGECRLPLIRMEDAKVEKLKAALKDAGLL
ncbi:MAG: 4-hydroxy-tetrahydrodipicolinate synthase [Bacteroides sp.]|nr:4-hydroxy-tetrahydrodipicolinate synthase [Eubacterium sp.]MCM1417210.1 4-hydroxy-tetrahydrodipicolinate synthase [Roseburia sp.]MCM1461169.1 4-hydroxy-tetrahydrodipicolinate synthase [Bacteroides sp.]